VPEGRRGLGPYEAKRDFAQTRAPADWSWPGRPTQPGLFPRFVIQEHHARRLHWDLRLEAGGVLRSWAVPKGVPARPGERRLAVEVEDHPLDYMDFQGAIPPGNYGAGEVVIWDRGYYAPSAMTRDKVTFAAMGDRLNGAYKLVRVDGKNWLMIMLADGRTLEVTPLAQSLTELTIDAFLDKLASSEPAPGGGSASALAVATAAGLVEMVANLTLGREQFAAVEADMKAVAAAAGGLRSELADLVSRDTEAFDQVMAALRLPKGTEEEKTRRREAVQAANKGAAEVPLRVTTLAGEVLALARVVGEKGNPNAITDAGVAGRLALAGAEGAGLNVRINLPGIKDDEFRRRVETEVGRNLDLASKTGAEVAAIVERRMTQG